MTEAGFFEPQRINRTGLALVITIHAAALTALALSKMEVPPGFVPIITKVFNVPVDPVPPEPQPETVVLPARPQTIPRIVKIRLPDTPVEEVDVLPPQRQVDPGPAAIIDDPVTHAVDPPRPPVEIAAVIDSRAALQPPYPPSEQRLGGEGAVKVRVLIGADGRVKAVEKVSATSDAFWRATERHALRNWRFRPATRDGRAVESWREMNVRFELTASA